MFILDISLPGFAVTFLTTLVIVVIYLIAGNPFKKRK